MYKLLNSIECSSSRRYGCEWIDNCISPLNYYPDSVLNLFIELTTMIMYTHNCKHVYTTTREVTYVLARSLLMRCVILATFLSM